MSEKQTPVLSGDEPPIPIPPVEGAWQLMRLDLDKKMPVRRWRDRLRPRRDRSGPRPAHAAARLGSAAKLITSAIWKWLALAATVGGVSLVIYLIPHRTTGPDTRGKDQASTPVNTGTTGQGTAPGNGHLNGGRHLPGKKDTAGNARRNRSAGGKEDSSDEAVTPVFAGNQPAAASPASRRSLDKPATSPRLPLPHTSHSLNTSLSTATGHSLTSGHHTTTGRSTTSGRPNINPSTHLDHLDPATHQSQHQPQSQSQPAAASAPHHQPAPAQTLARASIGSGPSHAGFNTRDSLLRRSRGMAASTPKTNPPSKNRPPSRHSPLLLAVGLSAAKDFPLGSQQSSPYNVNGKANLLSDYIPVPYLRYYIGNRIYVQAALQIMQPQYTRKTTIDSTGDSSRIPGWQQDIEIHAITLQKLYYTSIPLTFHYRVVDQLYLGAGLQFSRRWGGVAQQSVTMHPTNGLDRDTVLMSKAINLNSNDSVYEKIKKDDWRFLFDASYTWRRFTLGLRYQHALSPYLTSGVDGRPGKDKNSALGIYLQFDCWRRFRK